MAWRTPASSSRTSKFAGSFDELLEEIKRQTGKLTSKS
jgi:hypothetical protein